MEKAGIPTVTVISQAFVRVARLLARSLGCESLSIVVIEHPVGAATEDEVLLKADAIVDAVVAVVSSTSPSNAPAASADEVPVGGIADGAADALIVGDDLEEMFVLGWTDGLPVIPPTEERVRAMLSGTSRAPTEVVCVLPPRMAPLTVEKIAANAVMAGCLPAYLPVVLAAVEALSDDAYGLWHRQITTHAGAPLLIVNGPIVQTCLLNSGTGVFGPGWRANATIGRAIRLVLMNLAGAIPGVTDMSEHGHPGKYTYCIAEAAHSWEPLHVERGFSPDDSVVTVVNAEAPHSATENIRTTARGILETCSSALSHLGSNNLYSQGEPILALGPEHAACISAQGWSKADVKLFIYEAARQPWSLVQGRGKSMGPNFPKWLEEPRPTDMVPILRRPDDLIVIVCGGAGGKSMVIPTAGGQSRSVSRSVGPWL